MRFTIVALLCGIASATLGGNLEQRDLAPTSGPTSTCAQTATCTVTVTKPKSWASSGAWVGPANNSTSVAAKATGTPVSPPATYFTNAASSLQAGALAIAGGALAILAL